MSLNASRVHLKRHKYNEFIGFTVVSFSDLPQVVKYSYGFTGFTAVKFSDLPDLPQVLVWIYRIYRCQFFGFTTGSFSDLPDLPNTTSVSKFGFTGVFCKLLTTPLCRLVLELTSSKCGDAPAHEIYFSSSVFFLLFKILKVSEKCGKNSVLRAKISQIFENVPQKPLNFPKKLFF